MTTAFDTGGSPQKDPLYVYACLCAFIFRIALRPECQRIIPESLAKKTVKTALLPLLSRPFVLQCG